MKKRKRIKMYFGTAEKAVREAARRLDRIKPGWWRVGRFSLKRLHMQSCTDCVGGQVFADEAKKAIKDGVGEESWLGAGYAYLPDKIKYVRPFVFGEGTDDLWKALVQRRRNRARLQEAA